MNLICLQSERTHSHSSKATSATARRLGCNSLFLTARAARPVLQLASHTYKGRIATATTPGPSKPPTNEMLGQSKNIFSTRLVVDAVRGQGLQAPRLLPGRACSAWRPFLFHAALFTRHLVQYVPCSDVRRSTSKLPSSHIRKKLNSGRRKGRKCGQSGTRFALLRGECQRQEHRVPTSAPCRKILADGRNTRERTTEVPFGSEINRDTSISSNHSNNKGSNLRRRVV